MINSNFGFTPLKEIWLGDCYPESFYSHLPNEIEDSFCKITQWTKEDTGKLQQFLESRNIIVQRPTFEKIDHHLNEFDILVRPPITPRDDYLVLGETLYSLHNKLKIDPWHKTITEYLDQGYDVQQPINQSVNRLYPPALVRVGKDLYVDWDTHHDCWGDVLVWLVEISKHYRIHITKTGGHTDGVFCPVAPGIIVSSHYKKEYNNTFPDWKIFGIPEQLNNFNFPKNWYLHDPSIDGNKAFDQHIQKLAVDWVGDFRETVYEVNMLVLDEHNVVAMKEYEPLTRWLNDRDINVHYLDLRTRSFWDGGWHCLTLDIHRDDRKIDLFPQRGCNGIFWNLD